ncbi:Glycosyltransferase involved in cell wall bisynthesis [Candidatus Kryptonium thompsonii]|uniref:Glycosyltransferase involved in cell wall bisynthesis n=1 Tax=Candidatus Kryptonium thompsonii TaxID=1633631 RepID=A0A0P1P2Z8_9BACT|nr:glycosyltransferase family 2 protein [Candidatus Kryptonium thompsoni]CUS80111.1 Glycosyltransferase involved in cell wall bisynthesis [Candidatus Kryptonium thompsoni]CUS82428.1 Glycosyltransferase involved in cell wall bisynthesis [Candidatus Kryptonium thompsoni]CUS82990.1 Glycosyltransferase involved in cell wall bisynthesis [Candidatus Kryptonium thompsoni]CUS84656.1 Glycosyltransferase involved in cell wall bisynthesis [Candidatus Kryptonium thompsoni]CUS86835.1 Glycosyltransferase in
MPVRTRKIAKSDKRLISIVIPLYNEVESLPELYSKIKEVVRANRYNYEIIFVDDGSTDGSLEILKQLRQNDKNVKIISFRRNYGKSAALAVGFEHAKGDVIITMDADLQDDPHEIPNLLQKLDEGFDLVSGWKKKRYDPITKTIPSRIFNFVVSTLTGIKIHDFNCGLKAYRKTVAKDIKVYGELHRYLPVIAHWAGYKIGEVVVQHHPRKYGKTKFGVSRFLKGFLDLLTVMFTTRYFKRPLHLFGTLGLLIFILGFGITFYLSLLKIIENISLSNRPLFILGVMLTIVGIQFISIGLLGEMITKAYQHLETYSIKEIYLD